MPQYSLVSGCFESWLERVLYKFTEYGSTMISIKDWEVKIIKNVVKVSESKYSQDKAEGESSSLQQMSFRTTELTVDHLANVK